MINQRLATIAKYVTPDAKVVDVGTDHAFLPIFLIQNQLAVRVIGIEINHGPYLKAKNNIKAFGVERQVDIRQGDGLLPVLEEDIDVIVIAGLGGKTIIDILKAAKPLIKRINRIILQPMNASELVRNYLYYHKDLKISDEDLLEDNNRLYEIIIAEQGHTREYDDILIDTGPILHEKKHPLLPKLLENKILRYRHIADNLDKSDKITAKDKMLYYEAKANRLEKVLVSCL